MALHVLVESNTSAALLAKTLSREAEAGLVEVRASGTPSSLYAAARTLLAVRNEPVALVLDADSTDPEAARRRLQDAEEVIGATADAAPLRILVAVPALEALLFRRPAALERAFPKAGGDLAELGKVSPRDALARLDPTWGGAHAAFELIKILNDDDIKALREEEPLRALLAFLKDLQVAAGAAGT
jgi:hypothetical protein